MKVFQLDAICDRLLDVLKKVAWLHRASNLGGLAWEYSKDVPTVWVLSPSESTG